MTQTSATPSPLAPGIPGRVFERLAELEAEDRRLEADLQDPNVLTDHRKVRDLSIKRSALEPVVSGFRDFRKLEKEAADLELVIAAKEDPDPVALAQSELPGVRSRATELITHVLSRLVTTDDRKVGSVMMEVRAGTGGDEAALWARDLLDMYQKYAAKRGWSFELLDLTH